MVVNFTLMWKILCVISIYRQAVDLIFDSLMNFMFYQTDVFSIHLYTGKLDEGNENGNNGVKVFAK